MVCLWCGNSDEFDEFCLECGGCPECCPSEFHCYTCHRPQNVCNCSWGEKCLMARWDGKIILS